MKNRRNQINYIINKEDIIKATKHKSRLPLSEINKAMKFKIFWVVFFFVVSLIFLLIFRENKIVVLILASITIENLVILLFYMLKLKKMSFEPIMDNPVKKTIGQYIKQLNKVLKFERVYTLFSIPAYFIAGITISICLTGNFDLLNNKIFIAFFVFASVIIIPLVILGTNWMQKKAFGSYLEELKLFLNE